MIYGINHINLTVSNLENSFVFYRDIVGLQPLVRWHEGAYFLAGDIWFCLNLIPEYQVNPYPDYTHYAFSIAAEDFARCSAKIIAAGCSIFKENLSEGESLYFYDPDHHKLEIHVGNWQTRLEAKKANIGKWQNVEFF